MQNNNSEVSQLDLTQQVEALKNLLDRITQLEEQSSKLLSFNLMNEAKILQLEKYVSSLEENFVIRRK